MIHNGLLILNPLIFMGTCFVFVIYITMLLAFTIARQLLEILGYVDMSSFIGFTQICCFNYKVFE